MKIIRIFPLILAALFPKATPRPGVAAFDTFSVSPLYLGKSSTFVIVTKSLSMPFQILLTNDLYTNKVIVEDTLKGKGTYTYTYNNQYTRSNNTITIKWQISNTWVTSNPLSLKPISETYRTLVDNQGFYSNGYINILSKGQTAWESHRVYTSFTNFDGLYIPDYYHKIKLNEFRINVNSDDKQFFTCNPSLVISNVDGVFNDIATTSNVEFKLKPLKTSGGITFGLANTLYVHKETLMMSATQKEGYVPTNHIYLPRNEMQNQGKFKAYFALQNFGLDKDFVKHNFELHALKNIIGDCQNSEYCIQRL